MDKKKLVLLVVALLVAVGTAFAARTLFNGASTPQAEAAQDVSQGPRVLVAQRALPTGTIITADSINFQDWPEEMVKDAYFIDGEADMTKLLGTVVRFPITAGEPMTQGALVSPGDRGFLAAALGPGMRAVTIPVSAKSAVAGFVFPGDRVDLVLTQAVKGEGEALKASETILRNLRVLATDQSTETTKVDGKTVVRAFRMVTVEVTPRIAEKIAVAQTIGSLSLSLRSLADSQAQLERVLASGEVDVPEGASRDEEEMILRQAMNRPVEGATTYVTGADVSRFQRRTKPMSAEEAANKVIRTAVQSVGLASAGTGSGNHAVRVTRGKNTSVERVRGY